MFKNPVDVALRDTSSGCGGDGLELDFVILGVFSNQSDSNNISNVSAIDQGISLNDNRNESSVTIFL